MCVCLYVDVIQRHAEQPRLRVSRSCRDHQKARMNRMRFTESAKVTEVVRDESSILVDTAPQNLDV